MGAFSVSSAVTLAGPWVLGYTCTGFQCWCCFMSTFSLPSCAAPQPATGGSLTAGQGHKGRHGGSPVHRGRTVSNLILIFWLVTQKMQFITVVMYFPTPLLLHNNNKYAMQVLMIID